MNLGEMALLLSLFLAAFVPSLAILYWLRRSARGRKERWYDLLLTFAFGSAVAAIAALIIELAATSLLMGPLVRGQGPFALDPSTISLLSAVIVAPLVEEYVKALGVRRSSHRIWRPRNGLILGASVGLGFAATENFLYEASALMAGGVEAFIALVFLRSVSSTLLHASTTAIAGYGIARGRIYGEAWWPYLVIAILMHVSFNFLASLGEVLSGDPGGPWGLIGPISSILMVITVLLVVISRLRGLHA